MDIEQIKQKYRNLPQYMRDAIAAFDVSAVVQEIGKEHRLHIDQTGELSHQINGVLIGDIEREVFLPNIKKLLDIDDDTAKEIVQEVNKNIFVPIREDMRKRKEGRDPDEGNRPPRKESARPTQPTASINKDALAQIEKDKYREPIDNEDIAFDATGVPTDNPNPSAPQAKVDEEQETRASMLKEIEDAEEPPQKEGGEVPSDKSPEQSAPSATAQEEIERVPRASMVRNLMNKKPTAEQREPKPRPVEDGGEQNATTQEKGGGESAPTEEIKQPSAADKINRAPIKSSESRKTEINNDPYREPIE